MYKTSNYIKLLHIFKFNISNTMIYLFKYKTLIDIIKIIYDEYNFLNIYFLTDQ